MKNLWSDAEASKAKKYFDTKLGVDLALRTYTGRLIGGERRLVLHGGGNTSVKGTVKNILDENRPALIIKASGYDLKTIEPKDHCALDLHGLLRLKTLSKISDDDMLAELLRNRFDPNAATPSIEALLHAFIPKKFVDHTHADPILALTNRKDAKNILHQIFGEDVVLIDYKRPGFDLSKAVAKAFDKSPNTKGAILIKHGLVTWGDTAKESYISTISLVTKAEKFLAKTKSRTAKTKITSVATAKKRYAMIAPILRGLLSIKNEKSDRLNKLFILKPLIDDETIQFVESRTGKELALAPPITSDHIVRTKPWPVWINKPNFGHADKLTIQLKKAFTDYAKKYDRYFNKHSKLTGSTLAPFDVLPRVIFIPGMGVVCLGRNTDEADVVRNITRQTISVKTKIAASGRYEGIGERHLFEMEYFNMQHAKMVVAKEPPLMRSIALVTGAGGAIGSAICARLLEEGCHVAATDLPGKHLWTLERELKEKYGNRIISAPMDVTNTKEVADAFGRIVEEWGGIDLVVANAGLAHVSSLADMEPLAFIKLEKVNVEGTLHVFAEASRLFERQYAGGDIVLISTKNVFAPGAKFGAYSATKAAAHQLARIASMELAPLGVRVNMVSPDAVFSHGTRKSGLWAEVGPDRMRARGLSEKGLEDYYRNRNLLKEKITGEDVARAVIYFATRQTPTTGATIPVDGGLPDATPR